MAHADAPFSFGGEESSLPFFQPGCIFFALHVLARREAAKSFVGGASAPTLLFAIASSLRRSCVEHEIAANHPVLAHGPQHPCRSVASRDRAIAGAS